MFRQLRHLVPAKNRNCRLTPAAEPFARLLCQPLWNRPQSKPRRFRSKNTFNTESLASAGVTNYMQAATETRGELPVGIPGPRDVSNSPADACVDAYRIADAVRRIEIDLDVLSYVPRTTDEMNLLAKYLSRHGASELIEPIEQLLKTENKAIRARKLLSQAKQSLHDYENGLAFGIQAPKIHQASSGGALPSKRGEGRKKASLAMAVFDANTSTHSLDSHGSSILAIGAHASKRSAPQSTSIGKAKIASESKDASPSHASRDPADVGKAAVASAEATLESIVRKHRTVVRDLVRLLASCKDTSLPVLQAGMLRVHVALIGGGGGGGGGVVAGAGSRSVGMPSRLGTSVERGRPPSPNGRHARDDGHQQRQHQHRHGSTVEETAGSLSTGVPEGPAVMASSSRTLARNPELQRQGQEHVRGSAPARASVQRPKAARMSGVGRNSGSVGRMRIGSDSKRTSRHHIFTVPGAFQRSRELEPLPVPASDQTKPEPKSSSELEPKPTKTALADSSAAAAGNSQGAADSEPEGPQDSTSTAPRDADSVVARRQAHPAPGSVTARIPPGKAVGPLGRLSDELEKLRFLQLSHMLAKDDLRVVLEDRVQHNQDELRHSVKKLEILERELERHRETKVDQIMTLAELDQRMRMDRLRLSQLEDTQTSQLTYVSAAERNAIKQHRDDSIASSVALRAKVEAALAAGEQSHAEGAAAARIKLKRATLEATAAEAEHFERNVSIDRQIEEEHEAVAWLGQQIGTVKGFLDESEQYRKSVEEEEKSYRQVLERDAKIEKMITESIGKRVARWFQARMADKLEVEKQLAKLAKKKKEG